MVRQMLTHNAGGFRIGAYLAGWNRQVNAAGVTIAAVALLAATDIVFRASATPHSIDLRDSESLSSLETKGNPHRPDFRTNSVVRGTVCSGGCHRVPRAHALYAARYLGDSK